MHKPWFALGMLGDHARWILGLITDHVGLAYHVELLSRYLENLPLFEKSSRSIQTEGSFSGSVFWRPPWSLCLLNAAHRCGWRMPRELAKKQTHYIAQLIEGRAIERTNGGYQITKELRDAASISRGASGKNA
jgi:hypothetical protein